MLLHFLIQHRYDLVVVSGTMLGLVAGLVSGNTSTGYIYIYICLAIYIYIYIYQSEGCPRTGYLVPGRVGGRGRAKGNGCWLVVAVVAVGVTSFRAQLRVPQLPVVAV